MKKRLRETIRRCILFQMTVNGVAFCLVILGPFMGVKSPLTVMQMLWLNLVLIPLAALALSTDPLPPNAMNGEPCDPPGAILSQSLVKNILVVAFLFLLFLVWFLRNMQRGGVGDYDLSKFFAVFVMLQLWNLFNVRCWRQIDSVFSGLPKIKMFLFITFAIFLGQLAITQWGGPFFRTVPLTATDWMKIIAATSVVLWIGELWRLSLRMSSREAGSGAEGP